VIQRANQKLTVGDTEQGVGFAIDVWINNLCHGETVDVAWMICRLQESQAKQKFEDGNVVLRYFDQ
jgi:hypothetical protein